MRIRVTARTKLTSLLPFFYFLPVHEMKILSEPEPPSASSRNSELADPSEMDVETADHPQPLNESLMVKASMQVATGNGLVEDPQVGLRFPRLAPSFYAAFPPHHPYHPPSVATSVSPLARSCTRSSSLCG